MASEEKELVHLQVISGPDKGKMFFLGARKEALIGRFAGADLRLTDPATSQKHCVVRSVGAMVFIDDLNSRNGTRVNDEPISSRILDEDGIIKVGETDIQLTWVSTGREVPLSAVESPAAPTLLEEKRLSNVTSRFQRVEKVDGSTILDAAQFQEYRAARAQLGTSPGGFLLLEAIGMGSLGVVFRAKNVKTREEVALELIPKTNVRTEALLKEFTSLIKTGLEIPHTATPRLHDETDEHAFVVTNLLRGKTIQATVESGTHYKAADAVKTLLPICGALQQAHTMGVYHHDLRPAQILLADIGEPMLLDLGLPKKTDGEGKSILKRDNWEERLPYTSPEASREQALDAASNVYSMGAILVFMMTGKPPFKSSSALEMSKLIRYQDVPPLNENCEGVPPLLAKAASKALIKEKERRFQSIADFSAALKAAVNVT